MRARQAVGGGCTSAITTKAEFDASVAVHPTAGEELVTMRSAYSTYEDGMQIA